MKKYSLVLIVILSIVLPLLIFLVKQQTNKDSHAAAADKLEAESGIPNNLTATKTDSGASGGSYVQLDNQTSPTPTPPQSGTIYNVPTSIDGSGNTNVASALQTFVNSVPDGTATNP